VQELRKAGSGRAARDDGACDSGPGAVGDAGVDHGDRNCAAEAAAEQVRPEFCFRKDEELRLKGIEVGVYGPGQVERAVEDAVGAEAFAGKGLTGLGGGGDEQLMAGEGSSSSDARRLTASTSPTETA